MNSFNLLLLTFFQVSPPVALALTRLPPGRQDSLALTRLTSRRVR